MDFDYEDAEHRFDSGDPKNPCKLCLRLDGKKQEMNTKMIEFLSKIGYFELEDGCEDRDVCVITTGIISNVFAGREGHLTRIKNPETGEILLLGMTRKDYDGYGFVKCYGTYAAIKIFGDENELAEFLEERIGTFCCLLGEYDTWSKNFPFKEDFLESLRPKIWDLSNPQDRKVIYK